MSISRCSLLAVVASLSAGCMSGADRVPVPDFDPAGIGAKAVELCDRNGDSLISATEFEEAPSLAAAKSRLDKNGDDSLDAGEIAARIQAYIDYRSALTPVDCTVTKGGRPVAGATVTYEPEAFMGDGIVPATGTTNAEGKAVLSVSAEHLPSPRHSGVRPGFYRARVKLADGTEATKLNAGVECAGDMLSVHQVSLP